MAATVSWFIPAGLTSIGPLLIRWLLQVSPITHSIANTIKRVCIILATVLVFGNKLTPLGAIGRRPAVLSYTKLTKLYYDKQC